MQPGETEMLTESKDVMIRIHLIQKGVTDPAVLDAMQSISRENFIPLQFRNRAYDDTPLPIGHDQTISQPFIVGIMTQMINIGPHDTVL